MSATPQTLTTQTAKTRTATGSTVAARRKKACETLLRQAHAILDKEGSTPSALHKLKVQLEALAAKTELFPESDFPMPVAEARFHTVMVEPDDGLALHVVIGKAGKISNPHSHSIWCITASISGRERHVMWRRTDDGSVPGHGTIKRLGEVIMERGHGVALADQCTRPGKPAGVRLIQEFFGHSAR